MTIGGRKLMEKIAKNFLENHNLNKEDFVKEIIEQRNKNPERV